MSGEELAAVPESRHTPGDGVALPAGLRAARRLMGTRVEVFLPGEDEFRLLAAAEEALDEVERVEAQLSVYRVESELSGINAYAAAGPVRVEPRLFRLLEQSLEVAAVTAGAFDPALGALIAAWGFAQGSGSRPDAGVLAAARACAGAALVELNVEEQTIRFRREGVILNLGAIGKGYALDQAAAALRDCGIASALIHAGTSSVYGLGAPPGAAGWCIAIRDPRGAGGSLEEVLLRDSALSVSAPHGRAFREGERLLGHVLDPRTGEPVEGAFAARAVHPSAALSDALSTALLVLGVPGAAAVNAAYPPAELRVWESCATRGEMTLTLPSEAPCGVGLGCAVTG